CARSHGSLLDYW
nr:immunoglobulin heavy chain junction region [Mus musculus]MBK4184783.1 immunoglobulin heavy chain junction region [Mus musculus]MBK4184784.1 immunoglobulin heavy chain junction region [Mus musculus]